MGVGVQDVNAANRMMMTGCIAKIRISDVVTQNVLQTMPETAIDRVSLPVINKAFPNFNRLTRRTFESVCTSCLLSSIAWDAFLK